LLRLAATATYSISCSLYSYYKGISNTCCGLQTTLKQNHAATGLNLLTITSPETEKELETFPMQVLDELGSCSTESTKTENMTQMKNPVVAQNQQLFYYSERVSITERVSIWYCLQELTDSATAELKWQTKVTQVSRSSLLQLRTVKLSSPHARQ